MVVLWSLTFRIILIVYAEFFIFTLFLLYFARNDNDKDDISTNQSVKGPSE